MVSTKFITEWLSNMVEQFYWLRYEYEFKNGVHYIAVFPQAIIEFDEQYCELENDFYNSFVSRFPNETLLFGIEHELFTCSDKAIIFKSDISQVYKNSFDNSTLIIAPENYDNSNVFLKLLGCNNYALAA